MMISNLKYSIFQCHYTLHMATHLQWIAFHMDVEWASAFEFCPPDLPPAITHSAWYKRSKYFPHNYKLGQLGQYSDLASKINVQGIRGYVEFYLCNHVQTSSWAHTASHSIDTRTSFLTGKVAMAWHQPFNSTMPKITNDAKYTFTSKGVQGAAQTIPCTSSYTWPPTTVL